MAFDETYRHQRGDVYVALALATGSRDLAADTVDDAFRAWHSRVLRRRLPKPEHAAVMREALRRIDRMTARDSVPQEGFRLRADSISESHRSTLRALRELPLAQRTALVLERHTGWDGAVVAAATGIPQNSLAPTLASDLERLASRLDVDAASVTTMLDDALAAEAAGLREPISRAPGVKSAGMIRRIARAAGGLGLAGVIGAGLVAIGVAIDFGGAEPEPPVAIPDPTAATAQVARGTGAPTVTEARFEWVSGGLPIAPGRGDIRTIAASGADILIVGMEYSNRPQAVVARSADGLDWEILGVPFIGEGDIMDVAASADLIVAAGNRWDGGPGPQAQLWVSEDGFDWIETPLPDSEPATVRGLEVSVSHWVRDVDVVGESIIVVLESNPEFDDRLLSALVPDVVSNGDWGLSDRGIQVFDRSGQSTFLSWHELGLTQEEIAAVGHGSQVLVTQDRGVTWKDEGRLPGDLMTLATSTRMSAAVVSELFGPELWLRQGLDWVTSDIALSVSGVASFADSIYVTGYEADGSSALWRSADGEDWEVVLEDIGSGELRLSATTAGLLLWSSGGGSAFGPPAEIEIDGHRVQVFQTGGLRVFDPETDAVVAELSMEEVFMSGTALVVEDEDGVPVIEIHPQDVESAFEFREPVFEGGAAGDVALLTSANGSDWYRITLDGHLPDSFDAYSGTRVGDGIALLGWDRNSDGGQQLWVGMPAA